MNRPPRGISSVSLGLERKKGKNTPWKGGEISYAKSKKRRGGCKKNPFGMSPEGVVFCGGKTQERPKEVWEALLRGHQRRKKGRRFSKDGKKIKEGEKGRDGKGG